MFSGFGVDEIDSFHIINCPLPSISFSIIFHRASIGSGQERASSGVKVKGLRSLKLRSDNEIKVDLKQFRDIIHGLEGLEHLTLEKILIDWSASSHGGLVKRDTHSLKLFNTTNPTTPPTTTLPSIISSFSLTAQPNLATTLTLNKTIDLTHHSNKNITVESRPSSSTTSSPFSSPPQFVLDFNFSSYFPNLKSLVLISFLPDHVDNPRILLSLLKNLKYLENLDLRFNVLNHIPANLVPSAGQTLQRLYLASNSIKSIDAKAFAGLKNLQILDLFNNQLTSIPESLLSSLKSLKQFRIKKNHFSSLPSHFFKTTSNLESLDLSLNQNISQLPVHLFQGLSNLKNFSINDCTLNSVTSSLAQFFANAEGMKQITMRNNRLTNLTEDNLFGSNPNLVKLDVSYNNVEKLSSTIFTFNSSNLLHLNLYGNELTTLPDKIFFYLKNLKTLNLGYNNLKSINENLFHTLSNLESIDLSRNQLVTVNPTRSKIPFGLGTKLRIIKLSQNNLTQFNSEFESIGWNLFFEFEELDLSYNKINEEVIIPMFYSVKPTIVLDLRYNQITSINMINVLSYEKGFLGLVNSDKMRAQEFRPNARVLNVYIANNPFNCDCHLYSLLHYVRKRESRFDHIIDKVTFDINSDELKCSSPDQHANKLFYYLLLEDISCSVENKSVCPAKCSCSYYPESAQLSIQCYNRKLKSIPNDIFNYTRYQNIKVSANSIISAIKLLSLDLSSNFIYDLTPLSALSSYSSNVVNQNSIMVDLNLDQNNISSLPNLSYPQAKHNLKTSPVNLRTLSLRYNHLNLPSSSTLNSLDYIQDSFKNLNSTNEQFKLFLGHNRYNCTPSEDKLCAIRSFKSWLTTNYRSVADIDDINCDNLDFNSTSAIIHIPDHILCPFLQASDQTLLLTLTIFCIILFLLLFILSIVYYRNRQTVLAFFYIHLNPVFVCLNFQEEDLDQDKLYDAFVSYSSADRDIVMQLIEKLEKPSSVSNSSISYLQSQSGLPSIHEGNLDQPVPELNAEIKAATPISSSVTSASGNKFTNGNYSEFDADSYFNLCIHERDWLPGNLISWNIVNSVQNSRRTILILSKDFIESIWFQIEFHTAYYQMLEDKINRLIVIVRGELPPKEQLDKDLIFLLNTKTYLVWGEKWFWEKLRYALPHKSSKKKSLATNEGDLQIKSKSKFGSNIIKSLTLSNKYKQPSRNDLMKEYVDQAIANHFQLNSSAARKSWRSSKSPSKSKQSPKLTSAKDLSLNSEQQDKTGHVNESFMIETET